MSSTLGVGIECTRTDQRDRKRMLRSSFSLGDVDHLTASSRRLKPGESLSVSFERLLYCSVNVETLIRLTIGGNTLEMKLTNSLVLSAAGTVEFINPPDNPVTLDPQIEYVTT